MQLNFRNQLKSTLTTLLMIPMFIGLGIYYGLFGGFGFFIISILFIGPGVYLYFEYLIFNISINVHINDVTKKITVRSKGVSKMYVYADIVSIIKVCSWPRANKTPKILPTDSYFFYKIHLSDGEEIIITSLIADYIHLTGVTETVKGYFIPSIIANRKI